MAVLLAVIGSMLLSAGLLVTVGWPRGLGVVAIVVGFELVMVAVLAEGLPSRVMWWRGAEPADRPPRR